MTSKLLTALDTALSSKIVWFNIVMTIIDISAYLGIIFPETLVPFSTAVQGIGTIILRVWFSTVDLPLSARKKK